MTPCRDRKTGTAPRCCGGRLGDRRLPARWGGQVDEGWPPRRRMWGYPHRGRPGDPRPDSGLLHRARALLPARLPGASRPPIPNPGADHEHHRRDHPARSSRRELAHRRSCGIDVRLMWDPAGNDLTVEVRDGDAPVRARRARRRTPAARRLPPPVRLRRSMSTLAEKGVATRIAWKRAVWDDDRMALRVLIVDDHPGFRARARALLESEGFEVVGEAGSGAEGVRAAHELAPRRRPARRAAARHRRVRGGARPSLRTAAMPGRAHVEPRRPRLRRARGLVRRARVHRQGRALRRAGGRAASVTGRRLTVAVLAALVLRDRRRRPRSRRPPGSTATATCTSASGCRWCGRSRSPA